MTFDIKPTPRLPPELLDRIVDFADRSSATSCLLVSRHFHACALRNIYQDCNVTLTDTGDNLKATYQRLFTDEVNPSLSGTGRFVRSLSLSFINNRRLHNPPIDEAALLPLLESFREMPRLECLSLYGSMSRHPSRINTDWSQVPRSIQTALLSILGVISTLFLGDIEHFPIHSLCDNTKLQDLRIYGCSGFPAMPVVAGVTTTTIPNLKHFSTADTLPLPKGLVPPTLRSITTTSLSPDDCRVVWRDIKAACQSLETFYVYDIESELFSLIDKETWNRF